MVSDAIAASPRARQELADTAQRARLGGPFYVVGWAVVCLASTEARAQAALATAPSESHLYRRDPHA